MTRINCKNATLVNPKADFLKYAMAFSINIPLTEENLKLRDRLVLLAHDEGKLTVTIESPQLSLFDETPLPDSPNNITDGDEELGLTPAQFKRGLELAGEQIIDHPYGEIDAGKVFDSVVDQLAAERDAPIIEHASPRTRRRDAGTTTISHNGNSVTVTNAQFSKAAQRIEREGKAAAARSKGKTKKTKRA